MIQAAIGFLGGFGGIFDEAFWVGLEGAIEDFLTGVIDFFGVALMDLIRRH